MHLLLRKAFHCSDAWALGGDNIAEMLGDIGDTGDTHVPMTPKFRVGGGCFQPI